MPTSFYEYLRTLKEDVRVLVENKPSRKTNRSINQNNYYWGVVVKIMADFTGYTEDEMHDALRLKFLGKDGILKTMKSTKDLSTVEMEEYLANIRMWASRDLGVYIPLPNEVCYEV